MNLYYNINLYIFMITTLLFIICITVGYIVGTWIGYDDGFNDANDIYKELYKKNEFPKDLVTYCKDNKNKR